MHENARYCTTAERDCSRSDADPPPMIRTSCTTSGRFNDCSSSSREGATRRGSLAEPDGDAGGELTGKADDEGDEAKAGLGEAEEA
jgi:hypothetical protein